MNGQKEAIELDLLVAKGYGASINKAQTLAQIVELLAGFDPESGGAVAEAALVNLRRFKFVHFFALSVMLGADISTTYYRLGDAEQARALWRSINRGEVS